jgi:hypothetical protein
MYHIPYIHLHNISMLFICILYPYHTIPYHTILYTIYRLLIVPWTKSGLFTLLAHTLTGFLSYIVSYTQLVALLDSGAVSPAQRYQHPARPVPLQLALSNRQAPAKTE